MCVLGLCAACNSVFSAVVSVLRASAPAECPDCLAFGTIARLPQVFTGEVFTECTVEDGTIDVQHLPNFYCTLCKRAVFGASRCERFGDVVMPPDVLEPRIFSEQDAILWVLVFGGYWPGTPKKTRTVFRVGAIELRSAFKFR